MFPRINSPIKNTRFLSKTLFKNSVFQKSGFYFLFFTQFQFYCEEFWESTYKRPCSQSRTRFKAYRIHCNHSKSCCLLGVEKSCTDLTKAVLSSCVQGVDFGVFQDKKNLKRVVWGLDIGHKERTKIKSLVFAFAFFWDFFCTFTFLQVVYF